MAYIVPAAPYINKGVRTDPPRYLQEKKLFVKVRIPLSTKDRSSEKKSTNHVAY